MSTEETAQPPQVTAETMRAATVETVKLIAPHLEPGERTLIYILSQSDRIGHFGLETQIIRTLFEDTYDRILIVTGQMSAPGTNHWIRACAGPKIRFVETDNFDILLLGQIDAGLQRISALDALFARPRSIITRFYRHILAGGAVKPLILAEQVEDIARNALSARGIDPDAPFVFFHNRTLAYHPTMAYHAYRTAEIRSYQPAIARLIDAGYRVIRLGEPGLDTMDFPADAYVNVPDWDGVDRAVDLFVLARCAFGLAQNSGPIWVSAAFGRQVLRTNTPFEHLNMPYRDDLSLFKHYRRSGAPDRLTYRQILEAGIPAILQSQDLAAAGYEIEENTPEELLAATEEMLERVAGTWRRDPDLDARFRSHGADYEARIAADPEMRRQTLDFYGYAHPYGSPARVTLETHPRFLD
ncbi:MAG: TIGR04372 family glycosyltransferase [Thalassobaculaceae bacterium]|nr:TIGR04372 family glycosyltransferase [Thalassobaculaceae bacterium]